MSTKKMSDYLLIKTANYTGYTLNITPQTLLVEEGQKNQIVHEFDSGNYAVYSLGSVFFTVTMQWDYLTDVDAGLITDLYFNPSKADGRRKTFYWQHPTDEKIYVARFLNPLTRQEKAGAVGAKSIQNVSLRIEGVKT